MSHLLNGNWKSLSAFESKSSKHRQIWYQQSQSEKNYQHFCLPDSKVRKFIPAKPGPNKLTNNKQKSDPSQISAKKRNFGLKHFAQTIMILWAPSLEPSMALSLLIWFDIIISRLKWLILENYLSSIYLFCQNIT